MDTLIIKNICASLPSRCVKNNDIIKLIYQKSKKYDGDLSKDLKLIKQLLEKSGSESRFWCAQGETAIEHVKTCVTDVLQRSQISPRDVDLLIYVGVGRGFIEPSNAHLMAHALNCVNAQCFDIIEACMSWIRGLQIADSLFKTSTYRNALIINAEFNRSFWTNWFRIGE